MKIQKLGNYFSYPCWIILILLKNFSNFVVKILDFFLHFTLHSLLVYCEGIWNGSYKTLLKTINQMYVLSNSNFFNWFDNFHNSWFFTFSSDLKIVITPSLEWCKKLDLVRAFLQLCKYHVCLIVFFQTKYPLNKENRMY